jgi:hypothetical protein
MLMGRDLYLMRFGGGEGTDGHAAEGGRWSWRWTTGKGHYGRALAGLRLTSYVDIEPPLGARHDLKQAGGQS